MRLQSTGATVAVLEAAGLVGGARFPTDGRPWRAQRYEMLVDPRLEDLAGNSLLRVFDRDLLRPENAPRRVERGVVTFQPRQTDGAAGPRIE